METSDSEEEFFDVEEPKLNMDLVSQFLAMFDDGHNEQQCVQQGISIPSQSDLAITSQNESSGVKDFTSTLQRPSKFQKSVESDASDVPTRKASQTSVAKEGKYVSEFQIELSSETGPETVKMNESKPLDRVEYVAAIQVDQTGPNSTSIPNVIQDVRRKQAAAKLTNFFSAVTRNPSKIWNTTRKLSKPLDVPPATDEKSVPVKELSTPNGLANTDETKPTLSSGVIESTSMSRSPTSFASSVFTYDITGNGSYSLVGETAEKNNEKLISPTSPMNTNIMNTPTSPSTKDIPLLSPLPYKHTYQSKTTENFVSRINDQVEHFGGGHSEKTTGTSSFNINANVKEQNDTHVEFVIDVLPPQVSTKFSPTLQYSDDEFPPPPPPETDDTPPPLPKVPPPLLPSNSRLMMEDLSLEEEAALLNSLQMLRSGKESRLLDDQGIALPQNNVIKTMEKASAQNSNSKEVKNKVVIPKILSKVVATKQAPKLVRSPALPKWPPEPSTESSSSPEKSPILQRPEKSNDYTKRIQEEGRFGKNQQPDTEDVVLRNSMDSVINKYRTSGQSDKSDRTASWGTAYSRSSSASQTSFGASDRDFSTTDEEEGSKSKRTSVLQLLRSNSSAGHKGKPRWQLSVDSDDVLDGLTEKQVQLFELKFELITTEAEYFSRLQFLVTNFVVETLSEHIRAVLMSDPHKNIFVDLEEVSNHSGRLLQDLENCWKRSVYLDGVFDAVIKHFTSSMNVFIYYCSGYQEAVQKINELRKKDIKFDTMITESIESDRIDLSEQLKEPMNRIMQLSLLLKTCCGVMEKIRQTEDQSEEFRKEAESCREAAACVAQVCSKVDAVTGLKQRVQMIVEIQNSLVFPPEMSQLSLTSQRRWLVKKGTITQIGSLVLSSSRVGFKKSSSPITIFLFNDLIILTRMKGEHCYHVRDYGWRPDVIMRQVQGTEESLGLPPKLAKDSTGYYPIIVSIAKNNIGNTVHMFLSCSEESDRESWIEAMQKTTEDYHPI